MTDDTNTDDSAGKTGEGQDVETKVETGGETGKQDDGASVTDTGTGDGQGAETKAAWPDDWREKLANGDEKTLNVLKRFNSVQDLHKSYAELQRKMASGVHKKALSDNPTTEELAAWRKENGIPDAPEQYDINNLGDGLFFGEEQRESVNTFLAEMHKANAKPEVVRAALKTYLEMRENEVASIMERDNTDKEEAINTLREEFGREYKMNMNMVSTFLERNFPSEVIDSLKTARLGDGRGLFNSPDVIRSIVKLERTLNPAMTLTVPGGGNDLKSIDETIATYEKRMATDRAAWFKDEKAQEEYRNLITRRDQLKAAKVG